MGSSTDQACAWSSFCPDDTCRRVQRPKHRRAFEVGRSAGPQPCGAEASFLPGYDVGTVIKEGQARARTTHSAFCSARLERDGSLQRPTTRRPVDISAPGSGIGCPTTAELSLPRKGQKGVLVWMSLVRSGQTTPAACLSLYCAASCRTDVISHTITSI